MERLGCFISLKHWHDGAWTCAFNRDIVTSADGFGSGLTPWRAVQEAAWVVMKRA
jgi:hypothetical protein